MNLPRALLLGFVGSALLVAGYLTLRPAAPARGPRAATGPPVAAAPLAAPIAGPASAPGAAPAAVRAAVAHAFHDVPLDAPLSASLQAGAVAAVAEALARSDAARSAVQLFDLAALCTQLGAPPTPDSPAERARQIAGGGGAAARAVIDAQLAAESAFQARFVRGCAAAALDPARVRARLEVGAARGDAASLERLAGLEPLPVARLQSAALLGSARAQFRLALALQASQPLGARTWLETAAHGDADAEAYWGACLLNGCFGAADPPVARVALESAARRGALFALGALASAEAAGGPRRWSRGDAALVPLAPRGPEALGLDPAGSFGWTAFAASLARAGCFGFDVGVAAEALEAEARFERALRPVELEPARAAAVALEAANGASARRALGCD